MADEQDEYQFREGTPLDYAAMYTGFQIAPGNPGISSGFGGAPEDRGRRYTMPGFEQFQQMRAQQREQQYAAMQTLSLLLGTGGML